ncbi:hypothetical protein PC111_g17494 [Phytophthora cactorum]|nr:hypothetical protein PC111_g17494 [Phytophthora cactorum]
MDPDAAFLDEVSAILNTNGPYAPFQPVDEETLTMFNTFEDTSAPLDRLSTHGDFESSENLDEGRESKSRANKLRIQREKEALRKQRYQQRLKRERETLRRMVSDLSGRLEELQRARRGEKSSNVDEQNSPWRDLANQQLQQRYVAEMEQKKLVVAVGVQASYINTLRRALPDDPSTTITSATTPNQDINKVVSGFL